MNKRFTTTTEAMKKVYGHYRPAGKVEEVWEANVGGAFVVKHSAGADVVRPYHAAAIVSGPVSASYLHGLMLNEYRRLA